jgi:hypothetical protein
MKQLLVRVQIIVDVLCVQFVLPTLSMKPLLVKAQQTVAALCALSVAKVLLNQEDVLVLPILNAHPVVREHMPMLMV